MQDKIVLHNMAFFGYHGVYESERQHGQRFYVDMELSTDFTAAGKSDDLIDAIDYTAVYATIKDIVEHRSFQLLEALGAAIADSVLQIAAVHEVVVRIRKPATPLPGIVDYVQVEIKRGRVG